jgi:hypothetical protein
MELQEVAGAAGHEHVVAEQLPELRDVDRQVAPGARRRLAAPEAVDQAVGRDDVVRVEQEQREQGSVLRRRDRDDRAADTYLEWPEDREEER